MTTATKTIRQLRGKLSAATKRANEDREFGLRLFSVQDAMKTERANLVNMLVIALLVLDGGVPDEVVYFTKERLTDELIVLYPGVSRRLGRDEPEVVKNTPSYTDDVRRATDSPITRG